MVEVAALWAMHAVLGVGGVWLSVIDAREHRLPNVGTASLFSVLGFLALVGHSPSSLAQALVCAAVSAGALALLAGFPPRALGWGDVKLQVSLGFYLGVFSPTLVLIQVAGAFVVGGGVALVALLRGSTDAGGFIAFGPAMVAATVLSALLGIYGKII